MGERKGFWSAIESYVDILLNIIAMLIAYFFAFIVKGDSIVIDGVNTVLLSEMWTVVIIIAHALSISVVYHAVGLYATARYRRKYPLTRLTLKASVIFYGIVALLVLICARVEYKPFFLFWAMFACVFSTAFIIFKCRIIKI